jgi:hypothetical protein
MVKLRIRDTRLEPPRRGGQAEAEGVGAVLCEPAAAALAATSTRRPVGTFVADRSVGPITPRDFRAHLLHRYEAWTSVRFPVAHSVMTGGNLPGTGDALMSDVVVSPYTRKRSRISLRTSIERRWTFR